MSSYNTPSFEERAQNEFNIIGDIFGLDVNPRNADNNNRGVASNYLLNIRKGLYSYDPESKTLNILDKNGEITDTAYNVNSNVMKNLMSIINNNNKINNIMYAPTKTESPMTKSSPSWDDWRSYMDYHNPQFYAALGGITLVGAGLYYAWKKWKEKGSLSEEDKAMAKKIDAEE